MTETQGVSVETHMLSLIAESVNPSSLNHNLFRYAYMFTGMSTVISVRIRREVKERLEETGINIAKEVREYLENLAWKIRVREKMREWEKILSRVKPSEEGFSARSVREDRQSH